MPASRGPRPGATSTALLLLVLAVLGLVAWMILAGHRLLAGLAILAATLGSMSLAVDADRTHSPTLAFAAQVLDRAFEAAILAPVAWATRESSLRVAVLAMVGLGASYLASYERARGEALGYRQQEGAGYRVIRWPLLAFGLLAGLLEASLWAFAVVTVSAGAIRAANVARQERRARLAGTGGP